MKAEVFTEALIGLDLGIPPGEFHAPQFYVIRGSELGYHCHLYQKIRDRDTGILLTLRSDDAVFAETHRRGKVKKPANIESIPARERLCIVDMVRDNLSRIPFESRRRPSNRALLI